MWVRLRQSIVVVPASRPMLRTLLQIMHPARHAPKVSPVNDPIREQRASCQHAPRAQISGATARCVGSPCSIIDAATLVAGHAYYPACFQRTPLSMNLSVRRRKGVCQHDPWAHMGQGVVRYTGGHPWNRDTAALRHTERKLMGRTARANQLCKLKLRLSFGKLFD